LTWGLALKENKYRWLAIFSVFSGGFFLFFFPVFFSFIQNKPGILLDDVLVAALPAYDLSVPIFIILYSLVLGTLVIHFRNPEIILTVLATYCVVLFMRIISIYFFTLEPPLGWINLQDPFVSLIAYGSGFAKDLFFSGHTATLVALVLIEPKRGFRWIKIAGTCAVAAMLLIQHIHYTIDILAAPLFTYAAFRMVKYFLGKINPVAQQTQ
jgi:hypothetical protein